MPGINYNKMDPADRKSATRLLAILGIAMILVIGIIVLVRFA